MTSAPSRLQPDESIRNAKTRVTGASSGPGSVGGLPARDRACWIKMSRSRPSWPTPPMVRDAAKLSAARRMRPDAMLLTLANFDTCRGQLDQTLEELGRGPASTCGVPQSFPGLVRFPIVTRVEEPHPVQELRRLRIDETGNRLDWFSRTNARSEIGWDEARALPGRKNRAGMVRSNRCPSGARSGGMSETVGVSPTLVCLPIRREGRWNCNL